MAGRKPKKLIEERIVDKEELIAALLTRIKSEQKELDDLFNEKKLKDLESVSELIATSKLSTEEVTEAIRTYTEQRDQSTS